MIDGCNLVYVELEMKETKHDFVLTPSFAVSVD